MRLDIRARADKDTSNICGCLACQGKGGLAEVSSGAQYTFRPEATASGTVPSTIKVNGANSTTTGFIAVDGTYNLIPITVVAGETYLVNVRGTGATPLEDTLLGLFDQAFELVNSDDDGGQGVNSMLTFTADYSGTYYAYVAGFPDSRDLTGEYTLDTRVMGADEAPYSLSGAVTISLGTSFGFIQNSATDGDVYKINLTAGQFYTFQIDGGADYASDYLDLPQGELDTIAQLYDSAGNLVAENDDSSFGGGDVGSTVGVYVQQSGTYYLAITAYDNLTTGDPQIGGYTITASGVDPADYDPLDSIDWRDANDVPFVDVGGTPTAYVYFGDSDENFGQLADDGETPMTTIDWNAYEKQQVMLALEEYERILGVDYQITEDVDQATFRLLKTESEQYGAYFFPQDPAYGADQGVGVFNVLSGGWSFDQQQSLERGGYSFAVVLHEFGHAHGLAHPHDNGGGSDVMLGVGGADSLGIFDLNQGVYTVMSYNDAWQTHPAGPSPFTAAGVDNGWSATLGAFDIAQLQARYGVQPASEAGNTVYALNDKHDGNAFYETIWDTGGTDSIVYDGVRDAHIDLLAATLDYTPTGGGVVSFVDKIWGGYTIANGVVIENASGGEGNDVLLGNGSANVLSGNIGNDTLIGRDGNDTLNGGNGKDVLNGGAGNDVLRGGNGIDRFVFEDAGNDSIVNHESNEKIDLSAFMVAGGDVTLTPGQFKVELGAQDLVVNYTGAAITMNDFIFT
jgi:serralysin